MALVGKKEEGKKKGKKRKEKKTSINEVVVQGWIHGAGEVGEKEMGDEQKAGCGHAAMDA